MSETLAYAEIKTRYDSEWVLISDPQTGPDFNLQAGTVLWHSQNRDEVYRKAKELRPTHAAILYLGQLPHDVVVVL